MPAIAGIGFNWTKAETAIDISAHPGYCINYTWTGTTALQMELGWDEAANGYDTWFVSLPSPGSALDFPWASFKQDGWDKAKQPLTTATTQAVSLKIRLKNATAAEVKGTLTIAELGWVGECDGEVGIGNVAKASSAKAILSGRTLSFSGVKGAAQAEILNLQGQVMQKGSVSSAMDLSSLDAGVYMVRVAGSVNMTQKILVK